MLVELLGSDAARMAISSGPSPFDFAFDTSESTTVSFRDIRADSNSSDRALISRFIIFLLHQYVSTSPRLVVYFGPVSDGGEGDAPVVVVRDGEVVRKVDKLAVPPQVLDASGMESP